MLSAIPPQFFSPFVFFCDRPLTPPPLLASHGIKWDGPAGTDQHKVDCPTLSGFSVCGEGRVAAKGSLSGVTEQKQKHCVARQSTGFLLAPSLYLDLVQGKKNPHISATSIETSQQCECVSVCVLHHWTFAHALAKRKLIILQKDRQLMLLLLFPVTHTHTRTLCSVQCFPNPPPSNQRCPAVLQWAELR